MGTSTLQTMFWLLATVCLLCYGAIMPFNNIAQVYLLTHYIPVKVRRATPTLQASLPRPSPNAQTRVDVHDPDVPCSSCRLLRSRAGAGP
jgi:hypothetical protein